MKKLSASKKQDILVSIILVYFAFYAVLDLKGSLYELRMAVKLVMFAISIPGTIYAGIKLAKKEYSSATGKWFLIIILSEAFIFNRRMFFD